MKIDYLKIIQNELEGNLLSKTENASLSINLRSIEKENLQEVCLKLICIYLINNKTLDSKIAAKFVERLIASEASVGGPYKSENELDPEINTNIAIYRLLDLLDVRMPKLKSYIEHIVQSGKPVSKESEILLNWNHARKSHKVLTQNNKTHDRVESFLSDNNLLNEPSRRLFEGLKKIDKNGELTKFAENFSNCLVTTKYTFKNTLNEYGQANFYAWMSFSIYDDFIDNEGIDSLLPIANILHRKSFEIFMKSSKNSKELAVITNYFDQVDKANLNETLNYRFKINKDEIVISELPDYKNVLDISNRSVGHILGPILIAMREKISPKQLDLIIEVLRNYLTARQLNDDAHDWKDDLKNGHISYAVAFLLSKSTLKSGKYKIQDVINELQNIFWDQGLEFLSNQVIELIDNSLSKMNSSDFFKKDPIIHSLYFVPIKDAAVKSKLILEDRKKFIKSLKLKDN